MNTATEGQYLAGESTNTNSTQNWQTTAKEALNSCYHDVNQLRANSQQSVFSRILDGFLRATQSRYGIIVELNPEDSSQPIIHAVAFPMNTQILKSGSNLYEQMITEGLQMFQFNKYFHQLQNGSVIDNSPENAKNEFTSFMGIQLCMNGSAVGLIELMNRKEGYHEAMPEFLSRYLKTLAYLIYEAQLEKQLLKLNQEIKIDRQIENEIHQRQDNIVWMGEFVKRVSALKTIDEVLHVTTLELSERFSISASMNLYNHEIKSSKMYFYIGIPVILNEAFQFQQSHNSWVANEGFYIAKAPESTNCCFFKLNIANDIFPIALLSTALQKNQDQSVIQSICASIEIIQSQLDMIKEIEETQLAQRKLEELQSQNIQRTESLQVLFHELRNPLNIISSHIDLLKEEKGKPKSKKYISSIQESSRIAVSVISNYLEFSRWKHKAVKLSPRCCNLVEIFENCMRGFEQRFHTQRIHMNYLIMDNATTSLFCDDYRIVQLLNLLIESSITDSRNQDILLSSSKKEHISNLRISITFKGSRESSNQVSHFLRIKEYDQGIGNEALHLQSLMCKTILKSMNGNIERNHDNEECTVAISLPVKFHDSTSSMKLKRKPSHLQYALIYTIYEQEKHPFTEKLAYFGIESKVVNKIQLLQQSLVCQDKNLIILSLEPKFLLKADRVFLLSFCKQAKASGLHVVLVLWNKTDILPSMKTTIFCTITRPLTHSKVSKVLHLVHDNAGSRILDIAVIDDNRLNCKVAAKLLGKLGHNADSFVNAEEAIQVILADSTKYQLILMDLNMTELSGIEATHVLKSQLGDDLCPPIVAMTGNDDPAIAKACRDAGMLKERLLKPILLKDLETLIELIIE